MGKLQSCRICRTEENLKYSLKELKHINKKQLLLIQGGEGQSNDKASQKLLRTTPVLGNICQDCDERLQIFHNIEDDAHLDGEMQDIDDINTVNENMSPTKSFYMKKRQRADTPVIVDDDDMLYSLFLQKVERQRKLQQQPYTLKPVDANMKPCVEVNQVLNGSFPPTAHLTHSISTPQVDQSSHRIVAFIDLEENEELSSTNNPQHLNNQDEASTRLEKGETDEIVFRKVDAEHEIKPSSVAKRRKRKIYEERELRLVASLSLVSSDSEPEEIKKDQNKSCSNEMTEKVKTATIFTCKHCPVTLGDKDSFDTHVRSHPLINCPACHMAFSIKQTLVHHMRYKHREYNGNVLVEWPRAPQDSAMTIRLRYMQRSTFYECQLCGHIDEVFKCHKDHIIEKHAVESKCLRDPIMKQLKCPVCKMKCGSQYISLCRHLLACHEADQYKSHLREILHPSAFGWTVNRQREVAETAHIYQFMKHKMFFFECKLCHKVVAGYLHHLRHMSSHKTKSKRNSESPVNKTNSKSKEIVNKSKIRLESEPKLKMKSANSLERPNDIENSRRSKRKRKEKPSQCMAQVKIAKVKPSLVRLIRLQTYKCKFCQRKFKGFRSFNLHMLKQHATDEFHKCNHCEQKFMSLTALRQHIARRINPTSCKQKRKFVQLCVNNKHNLNNNCKKVNTRTAETLHRCNYQVPVVAVNDTPEKGNPLNGCNRWLQDLLKLNIKRNSLNDGCSSKEASQKCSSAVQCFNCLQLFCSIEDLQEHSKLLHSEDKEVLIRYESLKPYIPKGNYNMCV